MKRIPWYVIVIIVAMIIAAPIVVNYCISTDSGNVTQAGSAWIGFWGSYIGAVLGGIVTLLVMVFTLSSNHKEKRREESIALCENILEEGTCISELLTRLKYASHDKVDIIYELNRKVLALKLKLEIIKTKGSYKGVDALLKLLNDMIDMQEEIQKEKSANKADQEMKSMELCNRGFHFQLKKFILDNL